MESSDAENETYFGDDFASFEPTANENEDVPSIGRIVRCCIIKISHYAESALRLPLTGSMWVASSLPVIFLFIFALLFQPVLLQIATNDLDTPKLKRDLPPAFGMADTPPVGSASPVNWRFSLGSTNTTHADLATSSSKPAKPAKQHFHKRPSWRPEVAIIGDNLAVNVSWPSRNSQQRQLSHYRIQFRYRDPHDRLWVRPFVSLRTRLSGNVAKPYMYVTNKQPGGLEAGKVYQFQVAAVFTDASVPEERSRWSTTTSFGYISPEPPLVRVARRLPDGTVYIKWSRPWRQNDFKITRFIILFRREKRLPGGETAFHGFHHITVPGNLEEYQVTGIDRSAGYQFVVYGENTPEGVDPAGSLFTGGLNGRRITAFSQEVFVPVATRVEANHEADSSAGDASRGSSSTFGSQPGLLDMNTNASNSLMFLILGVLAGAMLIVMVFLVAICFFRQRKEKLRLLAQVNAGDKDAGLVTGSTGAGEEGNRTPMSGGRGDSVAVKASAGSGGAGFLLAELTPIAVANFRTAPPPPASVAGERDPLLLPPTLNQPIPRLESRSNGSSNTTSSEFNAAVIEMKREPPCGGSIHEESDDNTEKFAKETAGSPIPSPMRESILFARAPSHVLGYPLSDLHLHRRPPPVLGPGSQRCGRGYNHGYGNGDGPGEWTLSGEARGPRLGRLGFHSFAHHHPATNASVAEWLSRRRAIPAPFSSLASPGLSPPPKRIQAIVPQSNLGEVKSEPAMQLDFSRNPNGSAEPSFPYRAKSPLVRASGVSLLERLHPPRRRGSFDLRSPASPLAASTAVNQVPNQSEQGEAPPRTRSTDNDAGGVVSRLDATALGRNRALPSSPHKAVDVDFASSSTGSASFPATDSRTGILNRPV